MALGNLVSGYYGGKSSKAAAAAAAAAAEEMRRAKERAIGYQQPYYQSGNLGLNNLTGLLTGQQYDQASGKTTALSPEQRMALFQTSPGYQFRLDQATQALQASQAARGGLLSGGAAKELTKYSQGIASDEYQNYISNLFGLSGIGQNAANAMGNYEIGAGQQIADYTQAQGLAKAAGIAYKGSQYGSALNQAENFAALYYGGGMGGAGGAGAGAGASPAVNSSQFQLQSPSYKLG